MIAARSIPFATSGKSLSQIFGPISENLLDVASNKKFMDQKVEEDGVLNPVAHQCSAVAFFEFVFVPPQPIRTAHLFVDKTLRRFPHRNLASPPQGDAAHAKSVINDGAGAHRDRRRCHGVKTEPWRRDCIKICGVGEKRENLVLRPRNPELCIEDADTHG